MSVTEKGTTLAHAHLADDFAAVAERLCRSTVLVRGHGFGAGSGVIWRSDGLIVTNAHVVREARVRVRLADGRILDAAVLRRDPPRDLAALTVEAADLPAATIGDSDALRVGELVLAVGNPMGLVGAVSAGIIHATGTPGRQRWIQADVRLAPGNSGGPLADARGRVVGINSMVVGGLALAVPSKAVDRFLHGHGNRPHIGVTVQPVRVPLEDRRVFGLLVLDAQPGGAAEKAGVVPGDVLIGAGGHFFNRLGDLPDALEGAGPGAALQIDILRGGRRVACDIVVPAGTRQVEET